MPPKKRKDYRMQLKKKRDAARIKRLQETSEQRDRRRRSHRNYAAQSRAKSRDVFTRQVEMCQELYEIIRSHKTQEDQLLCRSFIRAPNRMSLPEYYDIVKSPIDLLKIQQKLKTKGYMDIQQFSSDIELMISNAKSYYKESSQVYQDACELWKVFSDAKIRKEKEKPQEIVVEADTLRKVTVIKKKKSNLTKRIRSKRSTGDDKDEYTDSDENESEPEDALSKPQWLLYKTVKNFINSKGQKLSELFWTLPSRRYYPDYYKEIKHPISLFTIKTKINQHEYSSLLKVVADMNLMFKYAKMYNKVDSKLFKGAVTLEKIMQAKAKELNNLHIKVGSTDLVDPPRRNQCHEKQAQKQKEEENAHLLSNMPQSPAGSTQESTTDINENLPYECLWDNCGQQFTDHSDLTNHLAKIPYGHIRQTFEDCKPEELNCLWYNCKRAERNIMPFSSIYCLIRHVKQVHLRTISDNPHLKKKVKLTGIRCSQTDPTTFVVDAKPPIDALVTQPATDYVFQRKCKKCNFSDMNIFNETTDGCNTGTVLKCSLCFTTKVFGMEYPHMEDKRSKSQIQSQVASIKQELVLPDDGTNSSFIKSSEPTRVEMMFYVDQDESTTEPESVPSDTYTAMNVTENIATTPDTCAHTQTSLPGSIRKLYTKYGSERKASTPLPGADTPGGLLQSHARPQRTMQMRELPNYPKRFLIRQKTMLRRNPPQTPFTRQPQVQPVITEQVPAKAQTKQTVNNQMQAVIIDSSQCPHIDFPQVASIKEELILPDDGISLSLVKSSPQSTRVENIYFLNVEQSTSKLSVTSDTHTAMDINESIIASPDDFAHTRTSLQRSSGQLPSSTTMNMTCDIPPMDTLQVDLNLVKKEINDETLCH